MKGTRRSLYWKALILLAALSFLSSPSIRAADSLEGIRAGLASWDVEQAWELAKNLLDREPRNPKLLELTAYVAFFRGDYPQALSRIREAMAEGAQEEDLRDFQLFVQRTDDIIRHHAVYSSDHFQLKLDEKMDGILVRYLLNTLEKTYHQMGSQYGFFPRFL